MTGVEWADKYFRLPEGSSQIPGAWVTQPLQIVLLNAMTNDAIQIVSIRKSARLGYTKIFVCSILYFAEQKRRSSVVYQPTDGESDGFVQDEIEPVISEMRVIKAIFPDWDTQNERNKVSRKEMGGVIIDFRGANSPGNFRRLTKQVVGGDEVDGWPLEVAKNSDGEGSPVELARKRIDGAPFPKAIFGTTPTIKGRSHIEILESQADLTFRFYLPCPHCGGEQVLSFNTGDLAYGLTWDNSLTTRGKKAASAYYQCSHCDGRFRYSDLPKMETAGRWMAEDFTWTRDGIHFQDEEGAKVDAPRHCHFVINALYSLNLSGWNEIVNEWLRAKGNPLAEKTFHNTTLGELYDDIAGERLEASPLLARREVYAAQVPDRAVYLTGAIDTQTSGRYEIYVWGWGVEEESWLIDLQIVYGRYDVEETLLRVDTLINKRYQRADGTEMGVARWCWDSGGGDPQVVYGRSKKHGIFRVIPIKGSSTYGGPIAEFPRTKNKSGVFLTLIGTDTAKELIYSRLTVAPEGEESSAGVMHFPRDDEIFGQNESEQLVAEVLLKKLVGGKVVYRWDAQGRRNETLDCHVYCLAALRISVSRFQINLKELTEQRLGTPQHAENTSSLADLARRLGG